MKDVKFEDWCNFTERQLEASKALEDHKFLLYGGAVGGGKSYWLRKILIRLLIGYYTKYGLEGVRVGLFCEDYPSLEDRQISKVKYEFPEWLGTMNESKHEFTLAKGLGSGVLLFRNLDNPSKYLSAEFASIAIDELTMNDNDVFNFLRMRLRWPGIKADDCKFITGSNPGGKGHGWVKDMFIDKNFNPNEQEAEKFVYIPAKATDNPYLDKGYYIQLEGLPPEMRKAYLEGDWNIFKGQYFSEWRDEAHVCPVFPIPEGVKRFRAYDHGSAKPCCCKWYYVDFDGRVWVYREFYKAGLTVEEISDKIVEMSGDEVYEYDIADPAIFSEHGHGESIGQMFNRISKGKINWVPASNDRVAGWSVMHQYLHWTKYKRPMIQYYNTCTDSIRTIPTLIYNENRGRVEDLNTEGEDHCFIGDTRVDTILGKRKIKDLVGKEVYVNTLDGFMKCRSVRKTRKEEVFKVTLENDKSIVSTADHRYLTSKGWKQLKELHTGDLLIQQNICIKSYLKLFKNLITKGIIYVVTFFKGTVKDYILQFINIIKEIFRKDFIFITKTRIDITMTYPIYKRWKQKSTYHYIHLLQKQREGQGRILRKQDYLLSNGISQKKVEDGIVNKPEKVLRNGYGLQRFVLYVARNIRLLSNLLIGQSIAIRIVKLQHYGEEEVYNLTVPLVEHFTIEDGIVVHNCADVDRYFLVSLRGYAVKHPITEMQRKQDTFKLMQSQDMRGYPTKEVQKRMTNLPQIPSYEDS